MKNFLHLLVVAGAIFCIKGAIVPREEDTELVLVHVIFRHGARTTYFFYPTDPNINETFYPIGLGGLTNEGKLGEYKLGRYLKDVYGDFLGDDYTEDKVFVRSTDITRTKMSAQLVLAGLFPPSKIQQWNEDLNWQPIPVSYKSLSEEDLFHPWGSCPYKLGIIGNLNNLPEVQDSYIKPYQDLYSYIAEHSGQEVNHPADVQDIYFAIKTESDMNMTVPEWTKNIFPEPMEGVAALTYTYHNHDPQVRRINSGYLLQRILEDTRAKMQGKITPTERKIFLYSGHEATIGFMLDALKVFKTHVPPYGSAVSFEVRKGVDQYYIKLRYRNDTDATAPIDLTIPGCDTLCPFETFVELQKDLLPSTDIHTACKQENVIPGKDNSK